MTCYSIDFNVFLWNVGIQLAKHDTKRGAFANDGRDLQVGAMSRNDVLHDCKAKTGAAARPACCG